MNSQESRIVKAQEAEERRRWGIADKDGRVRSQFGVRTRAAFRAYLPDAPRGPMSRERAAAYADRIQLVLDMDCWTRSEQGYLYGLRKKWCARARGEDTRFNLRGCGPIPRGRYTPADCARDIRALLADSGAPPRKPSMTERLRAIRGNGF